MFFFFYYYTAHIEFSVRYRIIIELHLSRCTCRYSSVYTTLQVPWPLRAYLTKNVIYIFLKERSVRNTFCNIIYFNYFIQTRFENRFYSRWDFIYYFASFSVFTFIEMQNKCNSHYTYYVFKIVYCLVEFIYKEYSVFVCYH